MWARSGLVAPPVGQIAPTEIFGTLLVLVGPVVKCSSCFSPSEIGSHQPLGFLILAGFGPRARFRRLGSLAGLSSMGGCWGFSSMRLASRLETAYGCAGAVHQSGSTRWGLPSKRSWGVSTTVHRLLRARSQKTAYVRKMVLPLSSPAVGCDPSLSSLQCTLTRVLPTH